jgi:Porin subfamily
MNAAVLAIASAGNVLVPLLAAAGDLAARSREHLEACALTAGGFYQVPGTDTCLRISGCARVDYGRHATSVQVPQTSAPRARRTAVLIRIRPGTASCFSSVRARRRRRERCGRSLVSTSRTRAKPDTRRLPRVHPMGWLHHMRSIKRVHLRLQRKLAAHHDAAESAAIRRGRRQPNLLLTRARTRRALESGRR